MLPLPMLVGPLPTVVLMVRALVPVSQSEAAPAVRFKAPALFKASVPLPVVRKVKGPVATVIVKPPVSGPVMVLAVVPEKAGYPQSGEAICPP